MSNPNKEIRSALERELEPIKLSPQMKRDIAYNARHSKKPSSTRQAARYVWTAAAVVVLLCATLPFTRGRINPDPQISWPIRQNNPSPVLAASGTENPAPLAAESTPVPGEMTDLFLRFENEAILPVDAAGELVWATENGKFYHLVSDCSGMQGAFTLSRNEASLAGKQPCPICIAFVTPTPVPEE
ncbi:MAG: hypothetical protein IKM02_00945, partial [Clostridia bacterium]|nr:hypothetical protein [Clostridia bacterium]